MAAHGLKLEEAAEYLGVSKWTLYRWRTEGRGPVGYRLATRVFYKQDVLDEWIAEHKQETAQGDVA